MTFSQRTMTATPASGLDLDLGAAMAASTANPKGKRIEIQTPNVEVVERAEPALERAVRSFLYQADGVRGRHNACGEHDTQWLNVLRAGLGHRTFMLIARCPQSRAMIGYLPLAMVSSRLFGRFLVSLPYLNRAGVVAIEPEARDRLIEAAVELAVKFDVQYLELRHDGKGIDHPKLFVKKADKVRMVLQLPDTAALLWDALPSKVRNQIRKGDKSELNLRFGGHDELDAFYQVFAVNMRDLGTPVYPRKLFACILDELAPRAEIALVEHQGQPAAAALLIHDPPTEGHPATTSVPSASSLRRLNHTNANMWMYHRLLDRAIQRGSRLFDFGRSSEQSGTFAFKKQWGAEPVPTTWQYHLRRGDLGKMRPDDPRNQRRIAAWKKLPVWVTKLIGPRIVRGIP
jgi:FemAB-related protein (PEP-CTERM system-associated)